METEKPNRSYGNMLIMLMSWIPITPDGRKDADLERQWRDQLENNENEDDEKDNDGWTFNGTDAIHSPWAFLNQVVGSFLIAS